jgi:hypothetical protein
LESALSVGQDVVIAEAKNAKAFGFEKGRAPRIARFMGGIEMLAAIKFDDQLDGMTDEVGNVRSNRRLAAKTRAMQAMSS